MKAYKLPIAVALLSSLAIRGALADTTHPQYPANAIGVYSDFVLRAHEVIAIVKPLGRTVEHRESAGKFAHTSFAVDKFLVVDSPEFEQGAIIYSVIPITEPAESRLGMQPGITSAKLPEPPDRSATFLLLGKRATSKRLMVVGSMCYNDLILWSESVQAKSAVEVSGFALVKTDQARVGRKPDIAESFRQTVLASCSSTDSEIIQQSINILVRFATGVSVKSEIVNMNRDQWLKSTVIPTLSRVVVSQSSTGKFRIYSLLARLGMGGVDERAFLASIQDFDASGQSPTTDDMLVLSRARLGGGNQVPSETIQIASRIKNTFLRNYVVGQIPKPGDSETFQAFKVFFDDPSFQIQDLALSLLASWSGRSDLVPTWAGQDRGDTTKRNDFILFWRKQTFQSITKKN